MTYLKHSTINPLSASITITGTGVDPVSKTCETKSPLPYGRGYLTVTATSMSFARFYGSAIVLDG